jgi:cysteine protease ATG4
MHLDMARNFHFRWGQGAAFFDMCCLLSPSWTLNHKEKTNTPHKQPAYKRRSSINPCMYVATASPEATIKMESDGTKQPPTTNDDGGTTTNPLLKMLGKLTAAQSSSSPPSAPTELEDLSHIKVVSPVGTTGQPHIENGFDTCMEYAYTTDDDEDNDNEGHQAPALPLLVTNDRTGSSIRSRSRAATTTHVTYILGKVYHPINHYNERRDFESSLFWFTYRCDFPEIKPYGITTDAGWGCMIRSAQMLLAQALRIHYQSRNWRPPHLLNARRQDPFVRSMLTWFADYPSTTDHVYSLHNMVAAGQVYDKLPGEWYGPGSACYVIRDLVDLHEQQQKQQHNGRMTRMEINNNNNTTKKNGLRGFRVHVAQQGTVYRDAIHTLMTRENKARMDHETAKKHTANPQAHPLDLDWEEELIESVGEVEWDTSLLLLVPLRLGLKNFNKDYLKAVAHTFSCPQSVGILGGRERGARWFYGASSDGSKVFALDPHTVQSAPRKRSAKVNGIPSHVIDMTDDYMRSCHTTYTETSSLLKTDPSITMGFYCRTQTDFEDLCMRLQDWKDNNPTSPELLAVADASPDYAANVSSAVNDMLGSSLLEDNDGGINGNDGDTMSEDDDYVLL